MLGEEGDALWDDIVLAERFLVSAMYASSLSKASEVLDKLRLKSSDTRRLLYAVNDQGLRDLVEAAGMVLVQATSEMGRLGSLFSILEDHFESLEFIPHYLVLPAICLQVSSQLHYPAHLALQCYLDGWSRDAQQSGFYTKTVKECTMLLPEDIYADLSEIFSVHVLRLNDPKLVLSWTEKLDLPERRRQELLEKLLDRTVPTPKNKEEEQGAGFLGDKESAPTKKTRALQSTSLRISFAYWVKLLVEVLRIFWIQALARISFQFSAIGKSLATIIMVYALIKKRHLIRRAMSNVLRGALTGLKDFWDLAFGLQINPLAAVSNAGH
ncbi:protein APEM9 [Selaginella moellendorffii]|uniref:protein APEM9 n=1 Tax=Selaginella moellendorffii TaxID=88036 RepID=UPI000D1C8A2A|nr:protein APEM9 [Selaginella moellendorffii]XP_024527125.1 protein APEM9 [Selaginella moellendorffii]|eukprot:XP_024527118.1 protein APEM9 [Selaginella moellendorffii]